MKNTLSALSLIIIASLVFANFGSGQLIPAKNELATQSGKSPFQSDTPPPLAPAPAAFEFNVANTARELTKLTLRNDIKKVLRKNGIGNLLFAGNFS